MGYKSSADVPEYLSRFGLKAFEYQCGRGVKLTKKLADPLRENARAAGISISLHAPYFISMSGLTQSVRLGSIRYFSESAAAVKSLGGNRIVFHSGSCGKQSRQAALSLALDTLEKVLFELSEAGHDDVIICPETMGKINQLGDLSEVLTLCKTSRKVYPCIDFGHLNARSLGGIKTKDDYRVIIEAIADALPDERATHFEVHFSKIEYTAGGEKRHLTFSDNTFGPDFEPLLEVIAEYKLSPTIICESDGTQAEDAAMMQNSYLSLLKNGL